MTEDGRQSELRQIEAAGRCFASALTQTDKRTMAALLRAAARYLDGTSGRAASPPLIAMTSRTVR